MFEGLSMINIGAAILNISWDFKNFKTLKFCIIFYNLFFENKLLTTLGKH